MDIYEFLSRPLGTAIPDFLTKQMASADGIELCRHDLAVLRGVVEAEAISWLALSAEARSIVVRLCAHNLVAFCGSDACLYKPTDLGRATVAANTSCIDGSDRCFRPPAHHRETAGPDDVMTYPFTTAAEASQADDDITDGDLMMHAVLDDIIADRDPEPPAKSAARFRRRWMTIVEFSETWMCRRVMWVRLAVSLFLPALEWALRDGKQS